MLYIYINKWAKCVHTIVFDPSFIWAMPFKQGKGILLGLQHLSATKISLDIWGEK